MAIIRLHPDTGKSVPSDISNLIGTDVVFEGIECAPRKVAPDAIRDPEHIRMIKDWCIDNGKYRDNLLICMGFGCGLRASDLQPLRVGHLLGFDKDNQLIYKDEFYTIEKKTTKRRKIYITEEIREAANLYFRSCAGRRSLDLNTYLFMSESNHGSNKPLSVDAISDVLAKIVKELNLPYHVSSHTLRKTFGYQFMLNYVDEFGEHNTDKALVILQKILNHHDVKDTLRYIGITDQEIKNTCNNMYGRGNDYRRERMTKAN